MKGMSKGDTLTLLYQNGFNVPKCEIFRKPFAETEILNCLYNFKGPISIRTWKKGTFESPFYPNRLGELVPGLISDILTGNYNLDEIILSEGIDPSKSIRCGKIIHLGDREGSIVHSIVEYYDGPGTVRELDRKPPEEVKRIEIMKSYQIHDEPWTAYLVSKCRPFFHSYPNTIIEWSQYPYKIGKKQDEFIFWEVL